MEKKAKSKHKQNELAESSGSDSHAGQEYRRYRECHDKQSMRAHAIHCSAKTNGPHPPREGKDRCYYGTLGEAEAGVFRNHWKPAHDYVGDQYTHEVRNT